MSILCQNVPNCNCTKSACPYCVRMYPTVTAPSLHVHTVSECTQLCQNVPNCNCTKSACPYCVRMCCTNTKSACRYCVKTCCTNTKSACRHCVKTCPELQKRQLVKTVLPYTCLKLYTDLQVWRCQLSTSSASCTESCPVPTYNYAQNCKSGDVSCLLAQLPVQSCPVPTYNYAQNCKSGDVSCLLAQLPVQSLALCLPITTHQTASLAMSAVS